MPVAPLTSRQLIGVREGCALVPILYCTLLSCTLTADPPSPALGCVGTSVKRLKLYKGVTSDRKLRLSL